MRYTVRKSQTGEVALVIDGNSSRCPFTPPLALPNHLTQRMDISFMPCSTTCPHAAYSDTNASYHIGCNGTNTMFNIEKDESKDDTESGGTILRSLN